MSRAILILDTGGGRADALRRAFAGQAGAGDEVRILPSVAAVRQALRDRTRPALLVVPEPEGADREAALGAVARLRRADPDTPIVVAAERGDVAAAARAVDAGATDFLVCGERLPERVATLLGKLRALLEAVDRGRRLDEQNAELRAVIRGRSEIAGASPQIRRLLDGLPRVARVRRPVLITGERGTGKELVARAIHAAAGPAGRPLVTVNCAAFSDALLESELFGHERGAFTGADATRPGKFELADGGTLFLDEIAHMSRAFQQKVLRAVEYGTFTRVGGAREIRSSARVIAATNADLRERIRAGEFLPDLYDRLAFAVLRVPPLREREGDVELLARHFLDQFALETPAVRGVSLSRPALARLAAYPFPGNVRELKTIIERAALQRGTGEILPDDLALPETDDPSARRGGFRERVDAFRRRLLADALTEAKGNQAAAARALGLPYHRFRYYWRRYRSPGDRRRADVETR